MIAGGNHTRSRRQVEQDYLDNLFGAVAEPPGQAESYAIADAGLPMECQLIRAAGLMLALPAQAVSRVLTDVRNIEPAAGASRLLAGRIRHEGKIVDVIDLATVILEGQKPAFASDDGVILLLRDAVTGLLCDALGEIKTVAPDRLCRRDTNSRRIWLAATARSDGFALLDIDGIRRLSNPLPGAEGVEP